MNDGEGRANAAAGAAQRAGEDYPRPVGAVVQPHTWAQEPEDITAAPLTKGNAVPCSAFTIAHVPLSRFIHRPPRLAFALALLAVLAQLWMAQLGATHLAQRVGLQAFWGEICTVHNSAYTVAGAADLSVNGEGSDTLPNATSCPVCSAAAVGFVPPAAPLPLPALQSQALQRQGRTGYLAPALRHAGLLPPAQAPPAAA